MTGLIKADLTDIIKKKRFMILMALAFLGALIMTIVVKVKLWNDQTFFFGMERYIFYGFNLAIGIILLISVYHRKFIRYSIQMVEEREQKRFCGVLSRFLSGILILMAGYVLMTLFMLLLDPARAWQEMGVCGRGMAVRAGMGRGTDPSDESGLSGSHGELLDGSVLSVSDPVSFCTGADLRGTDVYCALYLTDPECIPQWIIPYGRSSYAEGRSKCCLYPDPIIRSVL